MATKTTNYEFTKPNDDDYYDIQIENRNWDRADQQLKKLEEEKADVDGGDISETKIKTFDQPTEEFPVPAAGDSVKGVAGKVKKFFEDFKAFKNGVITVGRLVNNGLTTKEGFALDARYGKTLADSIAQLNSDLGGWKISHSYLFWVGDYNQINIVTREIQIGPGSTESINYPSECGSNTLVIMLNAGTSYFQIVLGDKLGFRRRYREESWNSIGWSYI